MHQVAPTEGTKRALPRCVCVRHIVQLRWSKNASGWIARCAIIRMTAVAFVAQVSFTRSM